MPIISIIPNLPMMVMIYGVSARTAVSLFNSDRQLWPREGFINPLNPDISKPPQTMHPCCVHYTIQGLLYYLLHFFINRINFIWTTSSNQHYLCVSPSRSISPYNAASFSEGEANRAQKPIKILNNKSCARLWGRVTSPSEKQNQPSQKCQKWALISVNTCPGPWDFDPGQIWNCLPNQRAIPIFGSNWTNKHNFPPCTSGDSCKRHPYRSETYLSLIIIARRTLTDEAPEDERRFVGLGSANLSWFVHLSRGWGKYRGLG